MSYQEQHLPRPRQFCTFCFTNNCKHHNDISLLPKIDNLYSALSDSINDANSKNNSNVIFEHPDTNDTDQLWKVSVKYAKSLCRILAVRNQNQSPKQTALQPHPMDDNYNDNTIENNDVGCKYKKLCNDCAMSVVRFTVSTCGCGNMPELPLDFNSILLTCLKLTSMNWELNEQIPILVLAGITWTLTILEVNDLIIAINQTNDQFGTLDMQLHGTSETYLLHDVEELNKEQLGLTNEDFENMYAYLT